MEQDLMQAVSPEEIEAIRLLILKYEKSLGFVEIPLYYPNPIPGATYIELALRDAWGDVAKSAAIPASAQRGKQ